MSGRRKKGTGAPNFTKKGGGHGSRRNLAPIDHLKVLYAGAGEHTAADGKARKINQKKDLMDAVRHMSPSRTERLAQKKGTRKKTKLVPKEDTRSNLGNNEIKNLEEGVNIHARRFNDLKAKADKRQEEVDRLMDVLAGLDKEIESLRKMESCNTPETVRIEELRKEIAAIEKEIEKKIFVQKQLEHMLRRLRSDEVAFDAHVKGMEDALEASKREFDEVKLLLRQLEAKKAESIQELHSYQKELDIARKQRTRELEERRQEANNAKRMEEWRHKRGQMRAGLAAELNGDLSKEEEELLIQAVKKKEEKAQILKMRSKIEFDKAMTLEEAFIQIRQATGVNSLEEMVEKFMGQGANKEALQNEKTEAESRLAEVRAQQSTLEEKFVALKASGIGGTELNREIYDRLDDEIVKAREELKANTAANRRLESVLVSVRLGALGLAQRLQPFMNLIDREDEADLPRTGIDALDALLKCELKLSRMIDLTAAAEREKQLSMLKDGDGMPTRGPEVDIEPWDPSKDERVAQHKNNVRVDAQLRSSDHMRSKDWERDDAAVAADAKHALKERAALKRKANKHRKVEKKETQSASGGSGMGAMAAAAGMRRKAKAAGSKSKKKGGKGGKGKGRKRGGDGGSTFMTQPDMA